MLAVPFDQVRSSVGKRIAVLIAALFALLAVPSSSAGAAQRTKPPLAVKSALKLKVTAPRSLVAGTRRIEVRVKSPKNLRSLKVTIGRRDVTRSMRREGSRTWRGTVTLPRSVRPGLAEIVASGRVVGGGKALGGRQFILGRRDSRVASFSVTKRSDRVVANLRLRKAAHRVVVSLNGKRVAGFERRQTTAQQVALTPIDGLRFGTNRISVLVARRDGRYVRKSLQLRLERTRTLATAGRDKSIVTSSRVRLDARRTMASGTKTKYRWRVVKRPKGSKAKLRGVTAARPTIRTDRHGQYVLELTANGKGGSSRAGRDRVTINSRPHLPPDGATITTFQGFDGNWSIQIGANCEQNYAQCFQFNSPYGSNAVQLIFFDRATLSVVQSLAYDGSAASAAQATKTIAGYANGGKPSVFGVLAAPPNGNTIDPSWANAIKQLTGVTRNLGPNGFWSAIGYPQQSPDGTSITGTSNNGIYTTGLQQLGEMDGYIRFDPFDLEFGYVQNRSATYDTSTDGAPAGQNNMRINGVDYPSGTFSGTCSGGFQVVALRATTLEPQTATTVNSLIGTNCTSEGDRSAGASQLAAQLVMIQNDGGSSGDGPLIFFMQSVGEPQSPDLVSGQYASSIAQYIEQLGGVGEVYLRSIGTAGAQYALVGGPSVISETIPALRNNSFGAESTSLATSGGGSLSGVLRGNHNWHYVPSAATPGGSIESSINVLTDRSSAPWPSGNTTGEMNALKWISNSYGIEYNSGSSCYKPVTPDVRFEYCDLSADWTKLLNDLPNQNLPSDCGCTDTDWKKVRGDILNEVPNIQKVQKYVASLQAVFSGNQTSNALVDLTSITLDVKTAVTPPNGSQLVGKWFGLIADTAVSIGSFELSEAATFTANLIGALVQESSDASYDIGGGKDLGYLVDVTSAELGKALADRYETASDNLGLAADVIVSDYGKLTAATSGNRFQVDQTTLIEASSAVKLGSYRFIYGRLMGAVYSNYGLLNNNYVPNVQNVNDYRCTTKDSPFQRAPANTWIKLSAPLFQMPQFGNTTSAFQAIGEIGYANEYEDSVPTPSTTLANSIVGPVSFDSNGDPTGLAEFLPQWMRANLGPVRMNCDNIN